MNRLLCLCALLVAGACSNSSTSTATSSTVAGDGTLAPSPANYDFYGAGTELTGTVPVSAVLEQPEPHLGKTVRLSGPIAGTCAKKGCWMRMGGSGENVFVKFKDYGFFVPTAGVEGRQAVVEGTLAMETQSVEELKHYLEDAGRHEDAAKVTKPKRVLSFVATGVAIAKP
jgi:hypothetical protein